MAGHTAEEHKRQIEELNVQAKADATAVFIAGPGQTRPNLAGVPLSDPRHKRERKTMSAYISRFKARRYSCILDVALAERQNEILMLRARVRELQAQNIDLRRAVRAPNHDLLPTSPLSASPMSPFAHFPPCSLLDSSHPPDTAGSLLPLHLHAARPEDGIGVSAHEPEVTTFADSVPRSDGYAFESVENDDNIEERLRTIRELWRPSLFEVGDRIMGLEQCNLGRPQSLLVDLENPKNDAPYQEIPCGVALDLDPLGQMYASDLA